MLRAKHAGQSVAALRLAKNLLVFEDGTQTVADRRLKTTKGAQPAIEPVSLTVLALGAELPNLVMDSLAPRIPGLCHSWQRREVEPAHDRGYDKRPNHPCKLTQRRQRRAPIARESIAQAVVGRES